MAARLATALRAAAGLELAAPPGLSVVCFRDVPRALTGDPGRLDALNQALAERIQADGRTFLTRTVLAGRPALRACVLHYGTTEADVDALVTVVRELGDPLAAAG